MESQEARCTLFTSLTQFASDADGDVMLIWMDLNLEWRFSWGRVTATLTLEINSAICRVACIRPGEGDLDQLQGFKLISV